MITAPEKMRAAKWSAISGTDRYLDTLTRSHLWSAHLAGRIDWPITVADSAADQWLNRAFAALGDPARRALVTRLSHGEATVNELAGPFPITKQAISRHIRLLEAAELITRTREAQRRPCHLDPATTARPPGTAGTHSTQAPKPQRKKVSDS
jgi:DNA-binding transcriptional ArsR family regulator